MRAGRTGKRVRPKPPAPPEAAQITDIVRGKLAELGLSAAVFGVWRDKQQIALGAVGDSPLGDLISQYVLDPLGMKQTEVVLTAQIDEPILHGYTDERKIFEDATFWNPTAFLHSGNMNSTIADIGRWVRALGKGELLSPSRFQQMMAPSTAGLGPLTTQKYFAFGVPHLADWLFMNPAYGGYNGVAFYDTKTATTIVVYATLGPTADADRDNAIPIGEAIATLLVPDRPPQVP
ncbi:MAG: hypothetical protein JWN03_2724 [Nocardia sp.]|uniref:serine hydrolase n=1 Tax=Nocardia sp. TaxID=1821 RepID=UPI0026019814|nr:serine hydrolase domain-containing protein [Nocardia sp.]MCU1642449.1 hypothetical protein [Nocardia sp.]